MYRFIESMISSFQNGTQNHPVENKPKRRGEDEAKIALDDFAQLVEAGLTQSSIMGT